MQSQLKSWGLCTGCGVGLGGVSLYTLHMGKVCGENLWNQYSYTFYGGRCIYTDLHDTQSFGCNF